MGLAVFTTAHTTTAIAEGARVTVFFTTDSQRQQRNEHTHAAVTVDTTGHEQNKRASRHIRRKQSRARRDTQHGGKTRRAALFLHFSAFRKLHHNCFSVGCCSSAQPRTIRARRPTDRPSCAIAVATATTTATTATTTTKQANDETKRVNEKVQQLCVGLDAVR